LIKASKARMRRDRMIDIKPLLLPESDRRNVGPVLLVGPSHRAHPMRSDITITMIVRGARAARQTNIRSTIAQIRTRDLHHKHLS
jgi:hypothetical protein